MFRRLLNVDSLWNRLAHGQTLDRLPHAHAQKGMNSRGIRDVDWIRMLPSLPIEQSSKREINIINNTLLKLFYFKYFNEMCVHKSNCSTQLYSSVWAYWLESQCARSCLDKVNERSCCVAWVQMHAIHTILSKCSSVTGRRRGIIFVFSQ